MVGNALLEASRVSKRYGAVVALRDASLRLDSGQIVALMGANGAGKSTLVKILTGAIAPTSGSIAISGQLRRMRSPAVARRTGLVPVYQEPSLIPDLDMHDNLRLGATPVEPFRHWVNELGVPELSMNTPAGQLPLAIQRILDLARALASEPRVLLLDEMTAALPTDLVDKVLEVVRQQKQLERSVIYISHRFPEIAAVCDRATVLRDGVTVGDVAVAPGIEDHIVELMLGESMNAVNRELRGVSQAQSAASDHSKVVASNRGQAVASEKADTTGGARAHAVVNEGSPPMASHQTSSSASSRMPALQVRDLGAGTKLTDVSFKLHAGEVLGVVALEGQGQEELFNVLAGLSRPVQGSIEIDGRPVSFRHPADAIAAGHVYVPGNRSDALLMQRSVRENIAMPFFAHPSKWGLISMGAEKIKVDAAIDRLQIDTRAQGEVGRLSGGNQQKVTIARWIAMGVRTLLCFDPTRGIDVRTKREIYPLLQELAQQGSSVLVYTSELAEVQRMCDRVIVIFGGEVVNELDVSDADEPTLMRAAYGLTDGTNKRSAHGLNQG